MSGSLVRSQTPEDLKSRQKLKEKGLSSGYVAAPASKFNSVVKSKIDITEKVAVRTKPESSPNKSISYTASSKLLQSSALI